MFDWVIHETPKILNVSKWGLEQIIAIATTHSVSCFLLNQLMSKNYCWSYRALSMKAFLWEKRKYQSNALYYLLLITSAKNNISPRTTKLSIVQTREITNQTMHIFVYTNWIFLFSNHNLQNILRVTSTFSSREDLHIFRNNILFLWWRKPFLPRA